MADPTPSVLPPDPDLDRRLAGWATAGLISAELADALARYEADRALGPRPAPTPPAAAAVPPPPPGTPAEVAGRDRRGVQPAEAIGYVGAAMAVAALAWLLSEVWVDLAVWAQLTLVGLLAVIALTAGAVAHRVGGTALARLASVLLTGGVVAVSWWVVLLTDDVLGFAPRHQALSAAVAATVLAVPLAGWRPRGLPQASALAAVVALAMALLALPALDPPLWSFGLTLWGLGVAWVLAALGGWLPPSAVTGTLGGVLALVGTNVASFDGDPDGWLLLGVATAGALIGLALLRDRFHHLVVGGIGAFVLLPRLVLELFGPTIGGPATLLVVGLTLVGLAVVLGRAGRQVRAGSSRALPAEGGDPS